MSTAISAHDVGWHGAVRARNGDGGQRAVRLDCEGYQRMDNKNTPQRRRVVLNPGGNRLAGAYLQGHGAEGLRPKLRDLIIFPRDRTGRP